MPLRTDWAAVTSFTQTRLPKGYCRELTVKLLHLPEEANVLELSRCHYTKFFKFSSVTTA